MGLGIGKRTFPKDFGRSPLCYISSVSMIVIFKALQDKSISFPAFEAGLMKRITGRRENPGVLSLTTAVLPSLRWTMVPMGYAETQWRKAVSRSGSK